MVLGDEKVVKQGKDSLQYTMRQQIINISPQETIIDIPFKDFYIPEWWHFVNNTQEGNYPGSEFNRVHRIAISNCINLKSDIEDQIEVSTLMIHRSLYAFYGQSGLFLCFYYIVLGIVHFFSRKKNEKSLYFHPQQNPTESSITPEEGALFNYITQHYMKDLSITELVEQTGIPEKRIIQHVYGYTKPCRTHKTL